MIAINHALTGAIIGTVIHHPLAIALAIASHFALDALPHYGSEKENLASAKFILRLSCDALLCFILVLYLYMSSGNAAWLAVSCAFLATSPDFMWIPKFVRARRSEADKPPSNFLISFHTWVQWFQRPIGWVVEAVWLVAAVIVLAKIVAF